MSFKTKPLQTAEELHALFRYEDGQIYWKKIDNSRKSADRPAGSINKSLGYRQVHMMGSLFYAHRIIFKMHNPDVDISNLVIDHKDGDRLNNRIENLRAVTHSDNSLNRLMNVNPYGQGVEKVSNRFAAIVARHGKKKRLGIFDTPEEAHAAYVAEVSNQNMRLAQLR